MKKYITFSRSGARGRRAPPPILREELPVHRAKDDRYVLTDKRHNPCRRGPQQGQCLVSFVLNRGQNWSG